MVDEKQLITKLEREIEERRKALPAHSVSAVMLLELEDLEQQLENLRVELKKDTDATT